MINQFFSRKSRKTYKNTWKVQNLCPPSHFPMQFSWPHWSFWQANYGSQALCLTPLIYSISQLWKSLFCFALLIFSNALHHTLISRLSSMMTSSCDSAANSCEYQCLISGSSLISICFGTLTRLTLITSVEVVKTTLYCMSVWFRWAVSLTEWEEVVPHLGAGLPHRSVMIQLLSRAPLHHVCFIFLVLIPLWSNRKL